MRMQLMPWGDWQAGYFCYFNSYACQMASFSFQKYRFNNPLVDRDWNELDRITPSGV